MLKLDLQGHGAGGRLRWVRLRGQWATVNSCEEQRSRWHPVFGTCVSRDSYLRAIRNRTHWLPELPSPEWAFVQALLVLWVKWDPLGTLSLRP